MATTVQVSDDTKRLLNHIQKKTHQTYDHIIKELVLKQEKIPRTLYGKHKDMPAWKKEDRAKTRYE